MPQFEKGEIVIEVDIRRTIQDDKLGPMTVGNGDLYFYPLDDVVRSRIIPQRSVGGGTKRVWDSIPSIPGQRIHVNPRTMKAKITDALNDDENRLILEQVKRAEKDSSSGARALGGGVSGGQKDRTITLNTAGDLHNWLYWMARAVNESKATLLNGELPEEQTLLEGGDIRIPGDPEIAKRESGGIFIKPKPKEELVAV